jgi:hypothetical protein
MIGQLSEAAFRHAAPALARPHLAPAAPVRIMAKRAPLYVAPADPMISYRPARFSARPVAAMQQILPIGEAAAILGEAFESTDLLFAATSPTIWRQRQSSRGGAGYVSIGRSRPAIIYRPLRRNHDRHAVAYRRRSDD